MRFTVITSYGKKANLFAPGVKTRQKFAELHGDPFQMDKNNRNSIDDGSDTFF